MRSVAIGTWYDWYDWYDDLRKADAAAGTEEMEALSKLRELLATR